MKKLCLFTLFLISLFSCKNDKSLNGNYYSFNRSNEYVEYYFRQDSLRIATENDWVGLSDWKKIERKNDTLFYETFGEWRDDRISLIEFETKYKVKLIDINFNDTIFLQRIEHEFKIEDNKEFWRKFNKRKSLNMVVL